MSTEPDIRREANAEGGRYVLTQNGAEAELTWSVLGPNKISADHTGVPDVMGGTGAGKALVERLVEDARRDGVTIVSRCSFVSAMARRHPEWSDLFG
ncbi:MAG: GNAT family N-acetyltransferase [Albidovulum sp.]